MGSTSSGKAPGEGGRGRTPPSRTGQPAGTRRGRHVFCTSGDGRRRAARRPGSLRMETWRPVYQADTSCFHSPVSPVPAMVGAGSVASDAPWPPPGLTLWQSHHHHPPPLGRSSLFPGDCWERARALPTCPIWTCHPTLHSRAGCLPKPGEKVESPKVKSRRGCKRPMGFIKVVGWK